ncbi:MAG: GIY-YIG nuclease family protein [candidate division Zixibacteria bacterium]|nr:GIY-YIG nuclease family protein [candidate division Zixibacteria bacterium]
MKYVYLLRSLSSPQKTYVGLTNDLSRRLEEHNSSKSTHTSKHVPWQIEVAIRFDRDDRATAFERCLKSGSGHAFAKRHFWSQGLALRTSRALGARERRRGHGRIRFPPPPRLLRSVVRGQHPPAQTTPDSPSGHQPGRSSGTPVSGRRAVPAKSLTVQTKSPPAGG